MSEGTSNEIHVRFTSADPPSKPPLTKEQREKAFVPLMGGPDRVLWMGIRQALLAAVAVIEEYLAGKGWYSGPRIAELRRQAKHK